MQSSEFTSPEIATEVARSNNYTRCKKCHVRGLRKECGGNLFANDDYCKYCWSKMDKSSFEAYKVTINANKIEGNFSRVVKPFSEVGKRSGANLGDYKTPRRLTLLSEGGKTLELIADDGTVYRRKVEVPKIVRGSNTGLKIENNAAEIERMSHKGRFIFEKIKAREWNNAVLLDNRCLLVCSDTGEVICINKSHQTYINADGELAYKIPHTELRNTKNHTRVIETKVYNIPQHDSMCEDENCKVRKYCF